MSDHDEEPKAQLMEGGTGWMYDSSKKVDLEAYLLGKKIDDAIDPTKQDIATDWVAGTGGDVQDASDIATRAAIFKTKDAFTKAREDPMFVIEKKKRNAKVDLKNNPLRMQKIRELLASELKKDLKKKKKKKHKSKKDRSVSPDAEGRREEMCPARPGRESDRRKDRKRSPHKSNENERSPEERRSPKQNKRHESMDHEEYKTSLKKYTVKSRYHSGSDEPRKRHDTADSSPKHSKPHRLHDSKDVSSSRKSPNLKPRKRHDTDRSPETTKPRKRSHTTRSHHIKKSHDIPEPHQKHDSPNSSPKPSKHNISKRHDTEAGEEKTKVASEKPTDRRPQHHTKRFKRESRPKMSAEEMDKRRAEMMQDAESRDLERREKYIGVKEREEADTMNNKKDGPEFVQDLKVAAYSSKNSTVEGRIKSGIFSKQRTKADLSTFLSR